MIPYVEIPSLHLWGPFTLQPFGLLVVVGCVVGYAVGHRYCRQIGLDVNSYRRLALWVTVSAFLMSHWASLGLYYPERLPTILAQQPLQLLAIGASMSSYGGLGGGALGALLYGTLHRLPLRAYGDALTVGWLAGWCFGRLGCAITHDHPGLHSDFMLAVQFPEGPRHDLGWYEWLYTMGLNLLVLFMRRRPLPAGALMGLVSLCYGAGRFGLDFLRVGDARYSGLTPAQYGSIVLLFFGMWVLVTLHPIGEDLRRRRVCD